MTQSSALEITPAWFATFFRHIWKNVVAREYDAGSLNSERALQAHVIGALSVLAPEVRTLVEPRLSAPAPAPVITPDILVYVGDRSPRALAVIELKFVPYHYPEWEKDIPNLATVITSAGYQGHLIEPVTGKDGMAITYSADTLPIFAAIGQHDGLVLSSESLGAKLEAGSFSNEQREAFRRILHAWGAVDKGRSVRTFDAGWLLPR